MDKSQQKQQNKQQHKQHNKIPQNKSLQNIDRHEIEQHLLDALRLHTNLEDEMLIEVVKNINFSTFKKGDCLLKQGDPVLDTYYLITGCVRQLSYSPSGKESTIEIYTEGTAISTFGYADAHGNSSFTLSCVEQSVLVAYPESVVQATIEENAAYGQLVDFFVRKQFTDTQRQLASFKQLTPEERFLWLHNERPSLIKRIPQQVLASYLDITPESFSRFKKRYNKP